ncbi:MAG: CBS domain-containing protein [Chloroflexota bacterium]
MSVEAQLLAEPIRHFLLTDYCVVTASTTVEETIAQMRETGKHTAFVVGEHTKLQGIVTDRDVMHKAVTNKAVWSEPITAIMTADPFTLTMDATAGEAMRLMDEKGFRNVPVINDRSNPVGNLTYFSLVDYLSGAFQEVVLNAPPTADYADTRDGG